MRSIILIFVSLMLFVAPAHALELKAGGVKLGGAFLETNFSFEGVDALEDDARLGLLVGVSSEWEFSRRSAFRIVVEGLYLRKGYEGRRNLEGIDDAPVDVKVGADYLSVPVLGRVLFVDDDLSVYAVFGPSFEFKLASDDDVLLDDFAGFSLAGNVGLGAEWTVADPLALQFELRFNTDLTDNYRGEREDVRINEARYQMLQVTLGLRY